VRHAAATQCVVRFNCGEQLELEIADDGCGIGADTHPGIGLTSMRERAAELGGDVYIDSLPARGTKILARLPIVETGA
jgi:signal transduction histidine kinase